MSIKQEYEDYAARREALAKTHFGPIWLNPLDRYVHPFRIWGNVWYVGDSWVCVHLIDTGDGLLLIDSGNCGCTDMLVQAIWEAGFNPKDVKWIIHSHGHLDHIGGANFFKKMFGTKLYLGEPDAREPLGFYLHAAVFTVIRHIAFDDEVDPTPPRAIAFEQACIECAREGQVRVVGHEPLEPFPADAARTTAADHGAIPYASARGTPVDEPHIQALLLGVHAEPARRFEPCLSTAGAAGTQSGWRGDRLHAPPYRFHDGCCLPSHSEYVRIGRRAQAAPRRCSAFS